VVGGESVEEIGDYAFYGCGSYDLETITLTGTSVKEIGKYAFAYSGIKHITIPEGITEIKEGTFWGASNLVAVVMPLSIKSIRSRSFDRLSYDIYYKGKRIDYLGILIEANAGLDNATIHMYPWSTSNGITWEINQETSTLIISGNGELTENWWKNYPVSYIRVKIGEGVTAIGDDVFSGDTHIQDLYLPDSLTKIGDRAFKDCTRLADIYIPENTTSIRAEAFKGCTGVGKVEFQGNSAVTIGNEAFYGLSNCSSAELSENITYIGDRAFYECPGLT